MAESAPLWIGPAQTLSNAPEPTELEQTMVIAMRYDVAERDERNRALGRAGGSPMESATMEASISRPSIQMGRTV